MKYQVFYRLLKDLPWAKAGTVYIGVGNQNKPQYYAPVAITTRDELLILARHVLNPEWFAPVDERYKPDEEDSYWYVKTGGDINETEYRPNGSASHLARYKRGNCFRTEEQAQEAAERIKETLIEFHKEISE